MKKSPTPEFQKEFENIILPRAKFVAFWMSCIFTVLTVLFTFLAVATRQLLPFLISAVKNGNATWGFVFLLFTGTTWIMYFVVKHQGNSALLLEEKEKSEQVLEATNTSQPPKTPTSNTDHWMAIKLVLVFLLFGLMIIQNYRDRWSLLYGGLLVVVSLPFLLFSSYKLYQQRRMKKNLEKDLSSTNQPNLKGE